MSETFPLKGEDVLASDRIVSQIGVAPIISMLKAGVDVIVAGRACDTAIYAAPCIYEGYDEALSAGDMYYMERKNGCVTEYIGEAAGSAACEAFGEEYADVTIEVTERRNGVSFIKEF
jgi:hypothetical protein